MSCCCAKILNLCVKVGTCQGNELWLNYDAAAPAGDYIFQMDFLNGAVNKAITVADDGIVKLTTDDLNENYSYVGKLYNSDGVAVSLIWNTVSYDCISFTTAMVKGSPVPFTDDSFPYSMPPNL